MSKEAVKERKPLTEYDGNGSWHSRLVIDLPGGYKLTVVGTITGCGLAQVHGIIYLPTTLTKEELVKSLKPIKDNGAGAVLATLGQNYYHLEPRLLELGFVRISEYANYRHGSDGNYKQRLYILTL